MNKKNMEEDLPVQPEEGVVLPGDRLDLSTNYDLTPDNLRRKILEKKCIIGPDLDLDNTGHLRALKLGRLYINSTSQHTSICIDSKSQRYLPQKGENVIGIVTQKQPESFTVDIGSSEPANLSFLAFEGATKKNRPDIKVGDIIYAKLLVASKHTQCELVCVDSTGKADGLGAIKGGGMLLKLNTQQARRLLSAESTVLSDIGEQIPYEIAIGMNGRVWINGRTVKETKLLCNILERSETLTSDEIDVAISNFKRGK